MPEQHYPMRRFRPAKPRQPGRPLPGVGGYDAPRGPYGEGGFPGSTPAAPPTHTQDSPEGARGTLQLTARQAQQEWAGRPPRMPSGQPLQPPSRGRRVRGSPQRDAIPGNWDAQRRWSPAINERPPGDQKQRNTVYYGGVHAMPGQVREYLASPNPGKLGGRPARDRSAGYDADAGAVVGGTPTPVMVPSRLVLPADSDGYAVQRPIPLKVHKVPEWYQGDVHVRGGILDGQRYTGDVRDQQLAHGQGQGAYGIARRRGPRHRPLRFERPGPWARNYYDVPAATGTEAPDMIHQSPGPPVRRRGKQTRKRRG